MRGYAMHAVIKRLIKWLVRAISKFLPEEKTHVLERWRRGREEFWKYNHCQNFARPRTV